MTRGFATAGQAIGTCMFSAAAVKRDTEIMMSRAIKAGIPLIVGSAGTSGSDAGLAWMVDIVHEIAREQGLHFKLAVIHSELSSEVVRRYIFENPRAAAAKYQTMDGPPQSCRPLCGAEPSLSTRLAVVTGFPRRRSCHGSAVRSPWRAARHSPSGLPSRS